MSGRRRVWIAFVIAASAIGVSAMLIALPLKSVRSEVNDTHQTDLLLRQATTLRTALADWQVYFEPVTTVLSGPTPALKPLSVATGSAILDDAAAQTTALIAMLNSGDYVKVAGQLSIAASDFTRQT